MNTTLTTLNVRTFTPAAFVEELAYRSYASNRNYGMTPAQWDRWFEDFPAAPFEARYQQERNDLDEVRVMYSEELAELQR